MYKPTNIGQRIGRKPNLHPTIILGADKIEELKNTIQDSIWHNEGDVWTHTQMVVNELVNPSDELLFAGYMHDIAKPRTTQEVDGRIHAPKHAYYGSSDTRNLLWDYDLEFVEEVAGLVRYHSKLIWLIDNPNIKYEVIKLSHILSIKNLYELTKADLLGRICLEDNNHLDAIELVMEYAKELDCYDKPYEFHNNHSKFKYFYTNTEPSILYDDTKFEVIIMCGIAGSGKTSHIHTNYDLPVVSLDNLRIKHKVKHGDIKGQGRITQEAIKLAKDYCAKKQSFVWDAMTLKEELRKNFISHCTPYNPKFKIDYIKADKHESYRNRSEYIPMSALDKMFQTIEPPKHWEAHEVNYYQR